MKYDFTTGVTLWRSDRDAPESSSPGVLNLIYFFVPVKSSKKISIMVEVIPASSLEQYLAPVKQLEYEMISKNHTFKH